MAGYRQTLKRLYFSYTEEGTFGTPETITHLWNAQCELPPIGAEFYSDTEEATGYEEETANEILAKEERFTISGRAHDTILPLLAAMALGGDTKSGTGDIQHRIQPAAITTELSGFTLEAHAAGATDTSSGSSRKLSGCVIDTFRLSGARKGWHMLSCDVVAQGAYATGSSQTEGSLTGATVHYPMSSTNCWFSTNGLEASFTVATPDASKTRVTDLNSSGLGNLATHIRSYEWVVANNLQIEDGYTLDSDDEFGVSPPRDKRVQTVTVVLDLNATTAAYMGWANATGTTPAFEVNCVTGTLISSAMYHGFKVLFPQMQVKEVVPGVDAGQQTLTLTCTPQDDATNDTVDMYVWNADNVDYGS